MKPTPCKISKSEALTASLILIATILAFLIMATDASSLPENITITDPTNDPNNDPITSNFQITVHITDPDARTVQAKVVGQTFQSLSQVNTHDWQGTIDISNIPNGNYQLTARYYNSTNAYFYVIQTTPITIQKPAPTATPTPSPTPTQYGSLLLTITDSNNQPLQDVVSNISGNKSNSKGELFIGNQPINQNINYSLSKSGYNTTYYQTSFSNNQTIQASITMHRTAGDISRFDVSGYDGMLVGRGNYITVKDYYTKEKIEGAQIVVYEGQNVKSIPGTTVNGRLFVSIPEDSKGGQYLLEVTKKGYEDWNEDFTIFAITKTPAPTPSPTAPTPAPTPAEKYRADADMKLTDDEYREWLGKQEEERRKVNESLSNTTIITPTEESSFPWTLLGLSIFALVGITYKFKPHWFRKPHKNQSLEPLSTTAATTEEMEQAINEPNPDTITIKCQRCDTFKAVLPSSTPIDIQEQILNEHMLNTHEEEEPVKIPPPKVLPRKANGNGNHKEPAKVTEPEQPFIIKPIENALVYRPDAEMSLTDEQYEEWLMTEERKKAEEEIEAEQQIIAQESEEEHPKKFQSPNNIPAMQESENTVACPSCGKIVSKRGLHSHQRFCKA